MLFGFRAEHPRTEKDADNKDDRDMRLGEYPFELHLQGPTLHLNATSERPRFACLSPAR